MPFRSAAQRAFLFLRHPKIARRFASETPKGAKLPEHAKPPKPAKPKGGKR